MGQKLYAEIAAIAGSTTSTAITWMGNRNAN